MACGQSLEHRIPIAEAVSVGGSSVMSAQMIEAMFARSVAA
jgi:hypothetical protein